MSDTLRDSATVASAVIALAALGLGILNYRRTKPRVKVKTEYVRSGKDESLVVTVYNVHEVDLVVEYVALVMGNTNFEDILPCESSVRGPKRIEPPPAFGIHDTVLPPLPLPAHSNLRFSFERMWPIDRLAQLTTLDHLVVRLAHGKEIQVRSGGVAELRERANALMRMGTTTAKFSDIRPG